MAFQNGVFLDCVKISLLLPSLLAKSLKKTGNEKQQR